MVPMPAFIFWMTLVNSLPGTQLDVPVGPFKDWSTCDTSHSVAEAQMRRMNGVVKGPSVTIGVLGGCHLVSEFPKVQMRPWIKNEP